MVCTSTRMRIWRLFKMMIKFHTWCLVDKGIDIHALVQGIAEKQNRICFHFEKLQNKKVPILLAFFAGYKFGPQMAPSVLILATSWCHLHQLKIGQPSDTTCICSKFSHQVAPLALVPKLAIRWRHLQMLQIWPPGCVTLPYWHYQLVLS